MVGAVALLTVVLLTAASCRRTPTQVGIAAAAGEPVLARIDDITITSANLREVLARYGSQPFVSARYSSIERKKELLDNLVRYQVLALEARKRGYQHDPEVVRVAKDKMVRRFTQQEILDKIKPSDVSDAQVESYYRQHADDYVRPETVRVSAIIVRSAAKGAKLLVEARALAKADMKSFRDLVAKHSEDVDSRQRGGDLMQFDRKTTLHPPALVAAAFALQATGDLSDLVAIPKGFAILKLTDRRPAQSRSLADSKAEIQRHLLDELRDRKKKEFVDEARKQIEIEIFEDELAKLDLTTNHPNPDGGVLGARQ